MNKNEHNPKKFKKKQKTIRQKNWIVITGKLLWDAFKVPTEPKRSDAKGKTIIKATIVCNIDDKFIKVDYEKDYIELDIDHLGIDDDLQYLTAGTEITVEGFLAPFHRFPTYLTNKKDGDRKYDRYKILAKSLELTRRSKKNWIIIIGNITSDAVASNHIIDDYTVIKTTICNVFQERRKYPVKLDINYWGHIDNLQYLIEDTEIKVEGYLAPRLWLKDRQHNKKEHCRYRVITDSLKTTKNSLVPCVPYQGMPEEFRRRDYQYKKLIMSDS